MIKKRTKFAINFEVIIIPTYKRLKGSSFEGVVLDYYTNLGYTVKINGRTKTGIPDFLVSNKKERFFVECKSYTDGLRLSQILWRKAHPKEHLIIAIEDKRTGIEKLRKRKSEYYQKNKEKLNAQHKAWRKRQKKRKN